MRFPSVYDFRSETRPLTLSLHRRRQLTLSQGNRLQLPSFLGSFIPLVVQWKATQNKEASVASVSSFPRKNHTTITMAEEEKDDNDDVIESWAKKYAPFDAFHNDKDVPYLTDLNALKEGKMLQGSLINTILHTVVANYETKHICASPEIEGSLLKFCGFPNPFSGVVLLRGAINTTNSWKN